MLDPDTHSQLQTLADIQRPLLVCDVDEVILHLVAPFEVLLEEKGYELRKKAVQLSGNVFSREDGSEISQKDIWVILDQLFKEQAQRQAVVQGACEMLAELHESIDIVLLTNLPHHYGDIRRQYLVDQNIPYPLVTNSGAKGPSLAWLKNRFDTEIAFMDDTPHHLESVKDHTPATHLIHFMANGEFRDMIGKPDSVIISTGDWSVAGKMVYQALTG